MDISAYLEHFSDADLALLARVGGADAITDLLSHLRAEPGNLDALLIDPALYRLVFEEGEEAALLRASPFLVFSLLVRRTGQDLAEARYVEEWVGPGRRVPMFEVAGLREFAAQPARRLFLAELLASYVRVASGSMWVQTDHGWRRRRFSELDPLRLIELLEAVPDSERSSVHRRLGDLALFLSGVFPDYAAARLMPRMRRRRVEQLLGTGGEESLHTEGLGDIPLLEEIGRVSYRRASHGVDASLLTDVANGFGEARRILNILTDRYVFPFRQRWFPLGQ